MKRDTRLIVNIGLSNNPMEFSDLWDRIHRLGLFNSNKLTHSLDISTYKGKKEETVVLSGSTSLKFSKVAEIMESLCSVMNQECIAFKHGSNVTLIYAQDSTVPSAKQEPFNEEFFVGVKQPTSKIDDFLAGF
jgi:hypothetical protein